MGPQMKAGRSVPPIHDITTDVADPPTFDVVTTLRGPGTNPLDYDAAKLPTQQQAAYPDVKTITSSAERWRDASIGR